MFRRLMGLALIGIFLGSMVFAQKADFKVSKIEVKEMKDSVQVLITSDGPVKYKSFSLDNPPRVRLFLPNAQLIWEEKELIIKKGLVKRVEALQYSTKPNIIQIEIYLAYQTVFELKPNKKILTLEIVKEVPPTTKEIGKEAKRHYGAGKRHYKRKEYKEAVEVFQAALKLNPKLSRAKNYIQKAELAIRERERLEKEKIEVFKQKKIKEEEKKRREERKETIEKHYTSGEDYYKEGKLIEAIEEWNKVLALEPEHKVGKRLAKAEKELKRIIEERKIEEEVNRIIAEKIARLEAERQDEQKDEERKRKIMTSCNEGKDYYKKGMINQAKERFHEVLSLDPKHKEAKEFLVKIQKEYQKTQAIEVGEEIKEKPKEETLQKKAKSFYQLQAVAVEVRPMTTRIIIMFDREGVKYSPFVLTSPHRIVVDISDAIITWKERAREVEGSVVIKIRSGELEPKIARIVIDLKKKVEYQVRSEQNQIIVDIKNLYLRDK
ncbi:AMIN domain-containing protein [bacterium]|nr:AMIN domain-containing protein [bacterium]